MANLLFALPAEMRNLIYDHFLTSITASTIRCSNRNDAVYRLPQDWPQTRYRDYVSLISACRQLHEEVSSLFTADFLPSSKLFFTSMHGLYHALAVLNNCGDASLLLNMSFSLRTECNLVCGPWRGPDTKSWNNRDLVAAFIFHHIDYMSLISESAHSFAGLVKDEHGAHYYCALCPLQLDVAKQGPVFIRSYTARLEALGVTGIWRRISGMSDSGYVELKGRLRDLPRNVRYEQALRWQWEERGNGSGDGNSKDSGQESRGLRNLMRGLGREVQTESLFQWTWSRMSDFMSGRDRPIRIVW